MQRKNVLALCNVQFKHVTTQGCNYYIWQFFSFSAAAELFGFVVAASVPNDQKNMRGVFAVLITMPWGLSLRGERDRERTGGEDGTRAREAGARSRLQRSDL